MRIPGITAALQEYGRTGVPLYLLYAKGAPRATVLPQILTPGIVLECRSGSCCSMILTR